MGPQAVHVMRRVSGFYQYLNAGSGLSAYSGKWLRQEEAKAKGLLRTISGLMRGDSPL